MNETKKVAVLSATGTSDTSVELPGDLFDTQTNVPLIHQVVTAQLAAARQGTHDTKTRSEVRGGGAKPWRQKGTGRARQGSRRAPQWVGGGIVHGPTPRSYAQRTPKKMVSAALLGVLSDRAREDRLVIVQSLVTGDAPSTKQACVALAPVQMHRNKLVVLDRDDFNGWLSVRNLPDVHVIAVDQLNAYDVVTSDVVVFTTTALEAFIGMPLVTTTQAPAKKAKAEKTQAAEVADAVAEEPEAKPAKKAAKPKAAKVEAPAEAAEETPEAAAPKAPRTRKPKAAPEQTEVAEAPKDAEPAEDSAQEDDK